MLTYRIIFRINIKQENFPFNISGFFFTYFLYLTY